MNWQPTINTPAGKDAVSFYVNLLQKYGPPGASSDGFNENLALLTQVHLLTVKEWKLNQV